MVSYLRAGQQYSQHSARNLDAFGGLASMNDPRRFSRCQPQWSRQVEGQRLRTEIVDQILSGELKPVEQSIGGVSFGMVRDASSVGYPQP